MINLQSFFKKDYLEPLPKKLILFSCFKQKLRFLRKTRYKFLIMKAITILKKADN